MLQPLGHLRQRTGAGCRVQGEGVEQLGAVSDCRLHMRSSCESGARSSASGRSQPITLVCQARKKGAWS